MKKAIDKVGAVVQVPVYEFAPYRRGWNGWLFSYGIIRKIYTSTTGRKCYMVEHVNRLKKDGSSVTKGYVAEKVFDGSDHVKSTQRFVDELTKEQFENAVGINDALFFAANGLINLK